MIQVGQILDKYELQERVGQGGMAVVYRGLDRSLKRTVAIKVLHRHLADSREARDRFEREAHAVAKLRHENILEIFAFSGGGGDNETGDSYIVTEFIDGSTLKEFVSARPLGFPEIGAMIVLQVCRALGHAHAAGILHRDVKPENIMIRSDGVVKLTDFGISQMVDLQRLTMTGQLLGSPAYMAPEHVEGQPLDFRTDVFACGIVLYQLTVGKLPFEGKNPHEILKRIAECKFVDPRQANPRVGNELGKIILRAMQREPDQRYADIGGMTTALEQYLAESGLGPAPAELARFFQSPASYEMALKARLVDHLVRRGKQLMATDRTAALQAFDRVLTLEPENAAVLGVLAQVSRRRRWVRASLAGVGLVAVAGAAVGVRQLATTSPSPSTPRPVPTERPVRTPRVDARPVTAVAVVDAGITDVVVDAVVVASPDARERGPDRTGPDGPRLAPDAAAPAPRATIELVVSPPTSEVSIGGADFRRFPGGRGTITLDREAVEVTVRNDECCESQSRTLRAADAGKTAAFSLAFLPARVKPVCDVPGVTVRVDGRVARLGKDASIPFGDTTQLRKTVVVEFVGERIDTQRVQVTAAEAREVTCALP